MTARFIQLHTLISYPAVLLNRDDAGMAKRLPYGGVSRTRVSSQSLKRHWRKAEDVWALEAIGAPMAVRSRMTVEREIMPKVDAAPDIKIAIQIALAQFLFGEKNVDPKRPESTEKRQALLLGQPEIEFLTSVAIDAAATGNAKAATAFLETALGKGEGKKNLAALKESAKLSFGLESALFGRMVTSDPAANVDAAIHVAHAFTVQAEESESDYFTVVDDLSGDDAGTAGIFDTELSSGIFYSYVVVDILGLVGNVGGDDELAAKVVEHLVHLIATITPGAKKGSTAPYGYAELMLVETGTAQPRSLAGAFRKPIAKTGGVGEAVAALAAQLAAFDLAYESGESRAALCLTSSEIPGVAAPISLAALAKFAAAAVVRAG
jgi:CRISPR system Cascade subunit CasC